MVIVIHGTKGGYHIFTPGRVGGCMDSRPDSSKVAAIGQHAYSINYYKDDVIFSKYKIIRDVIGDKRTGNVAFSVVIPLKKKLQGKDIIELLDNLEKEYSSKYIVDDNLGNAKEDWSFLNELIRNYQLLPNSIEDLENFHEGAQEAAFLYYSNNEKLYKYFDAPFQDEYEQFKQIFFIESDFKGKDENPLNALRHNPVSDLTDKIDIENLPYTLRFDEYIKDGVKVEVRVNGAKRFNKTKIKRNDELEIIYSKPYHKTKPIRGKLDAISNEYVEVNDDMLTVRIKEVKLLGENKEVKFYIHGINDNDLLLNYNIEIFHKGIQPTNGVSNFVGDEIGKVWEISVSHQDYETQRFGYCPAKDENPKHVTLQKKLYPQERSHDNRRRHEKRYSLKIDEERGKRSYNGKIIGAYITNDPHFNCDSKFGYEFERWDFKDQEYLEFSGYYEAIFRELWYHKIPRSVWGGAIVMIIISSIVLAVSLESSDKGNTPKQQSVSDKILDYVDGIELNKDTLESYKTHYCNKTTDTNNKHGESFWKKIFPFGSRTEENLKLQSTALPTYCSKIDVALDIREAITNGKIDELKSKSFSSKQEDFKLVITKIENKYENQISDSLVEHNVSEMDLNQIAALIKQVQESLRTEELSPNQKTAQPKQSKPPQASKQQGEGNTQREAQLSKTQTLQQSTSSLETEFWNLVHSGNVTKNTYDKLLKEFKNHVNVSMVDIDIVSYLNKICKNSDSFNKFKNIPELDRKQATALTDIDIN